MMKEQQQRAIKGAADNARLTNGNVACNTLKASDKTEPSIDLGLPDYQCIKGMYYIGFSKT